MMVGPAVVGKTYGMNHAAALDSRFQRVPVFTTRGWRDDDDPGMFRYIPHTDEGVNSLLDMIEDKDGPAVQYAVHPSTGRIYGTVANDYPGQYNMLATLSGAVDGLRRLPFHSTHVIGLYADGEVWTERFMQRHINNPAEGRKRLNEAEISMEWLLSQDKDTICWVYNREGDPTGSAKAIIGFATTGKRPYPSLSHTPEQFLDSIRNIKFDS